MKPSTLTLLGLLGGIGLAGGFIFMTQSSIKPLEIRPQSRKTSIAPRPVATSPDRLEHRSKRDSLPHRSEPPPRPQPSQQPEVAPDAPIERIDGGEIHQVVRAHMKWGEVLGALKGTHDPFVLDLTDRIRELRREMMAMRRRPETVNHRELAQRQRMLLGELRQIPSWGPELSKTTEQLHRLLDEDGQD
jgi:hypothetical protein